MRLRPALLRGTPVKLRKPSPQMCGARSTDATALGFVTACRYIVCLP
jgi:hypothetical protein